MAPMLMNNKIFRALRALANEYGVPWDYETGGKHPFFIVTIGDKEIRRPFSSTPSDGRAAMSACQEWRKLIEEALEEATKPPEAAVATPLEPAKEEKAPDPREVRDLTRIEYRGQAVVTLKMVDEVHGRVEGTAGRQFRAIKRDGRLVEGVDYYPLDNASVDEIRRYTPGAFGQSAKHGVLLTMRGYLKVIKGFQDDLAWQRQNEMIEVYFLVDKVKRAIVGNDVDVVLELLNEAFEGQRSTNKDLTTAVRDGVDRIMTELSAARPGDDAETATLLPVELGKAKAAVMAYVRDHCKLPLEKMRHEMCEHRKWLDERVDAQHRRDVMMIHRLDELKGALRAGAEAQVRADAVTITAILDIVGIPEAHRGKRLSSALSTNARTWFPDRGYYCRRHEPIDASPWTFQRDKVQDWWESAGLAIYERLRPTADVVHLKTA